MITAHRVQVPSVDALSPDKEEISELITMTPEELLSRMQSKDEAFEFDTNHAYMYLEYLKTRLPERENEIVQEQQKLKHSLVQIDAFSKDEKIS